jgi:hypothetical protein
MKINEPDIIAVREMPTGLPEPTDESVSRTWYAVTRRQAAADAPRRRRRALVPVAAAAVVLGLAAGGAALFAPAGDPDSDTPVAALPAAGTPIDARAALDALTAAGRTAAAAPLAAGQLIYVHTEGVTASYNVGSDNGTIGREDHEMWLDPQGMIALKITRDGEDMMDGASEKVPAAGGAITDAQETDPQETDPQETDPQKKAALEKKLGDPEAEIAQLRQELADNGPSAIRPTPAWLAGLPADPAAVRALLLGDTGVNKWSDDHRLFTAVSDLLINAEPILAPATRTALYGALGTISELTALDTTAEGLRVYAIRHTENGSIDELLFDPASGRFLGRGSGHESLPAPAAAGGIEPPVDAGISYRAVSTYKIVSAAGER